MAKTGVKGGKNQITGQKTAVHSYAFLAFAHTEQRTNEYVMNAVQSLP